MQAKMCILVSLLRLQHFVCINKEDKVEENKEVAPTSIVTV